MEPIVALERASYTYQPHSPVRHTALREVTLEVAAGRTLGVIGHTGSGKSTLLRLLNGEFTPTAGAARWGAPLAGPGGRPRPGAIGLVFQYPEDQLFEETVLADVMFGPLQVGRPPDEARRAAERALDRLGLPASRFGEASPFDLSGGQKRKAAIAGVIALDPALLALDEPTSGLDPASRRRFLGLLADLAREGRTIVVVSHDLEAIAVLCDRVALLDRGALAAAGPAAAILADVPLLSAARVGAHPIPAFLRDLAELGADVRHGALDLPAFEAEMRRLAALARR